MRPKWANIIIFVLTILFLVILANFSPEAWEPRFPPRLMRFLFWAGVIVLMYGVLNPPEKT